jgi:hypothetical protein
MDSPSLDFSPRIYFADEVRSRFGLSVCSPSPDDVASFWLVVAFSRSKFRLSTSSVGRILQSVLGGSADLFSVVELEQQLFKFSVLNRLVGLHVYALKSFAYEDHVWFEDRWMVASLCDE